LRPAPAERLRPLSIESLAYRIDGGDYGGTAELARTNQAGPGVDPCRDLPRDQGGRSIAFHQIHEPPGKAVKYEKVVPGVGPVDRDEIIKGYEVDKGEYVCSSPKRLRRSSWRAARRSNCPVRRPDDIDAIYFDKPYFVVPPTTLPRRRSSSCGMRFADQESWRRAARNARSGICCKPQALRSRDGA
jgi:hypothetical protein